MRCFGVIHQQLAAGNWRSVRPRARLPGSIAMALDRIHLSAFRNHAHSSIEGTSRFNLVVGQNGAGKTNILEALSLLAPGRGLRRASLSDMAQAGSTEGFAISAKLIGDGPSDPVSLGTGTDAAQPGRRQVRINGARSSATA